MKIKALAAEARIIRCEEGRQRGELRGSLYAHRVGEVRREQRASVLAYAFLRGRQYRDVERSVRRKPDIARVKRLAYKFGPMSERDAAAAIDQWITHAEPCGRHPGVMTQARAGSTPAACTTPG